MGGYGSMISISGYYHVDDPSNMFGGDQSVIAANRPDRNLAVARSHHRLGLSQPTTGKPVRCQNSATAAELGECRGLRCGKRSGLVSLRLLYLVLCNLAS